MCFCKISVLLNIFFTHVTQTKYSLTKKSHEHFYLQWAVNVKFTCKIFTRIFYDISCKILFSRKIHIFTFKWISCKHDLLKNLSKKYKYHMKLVSHELHTWWIYQCKPNKIRVIQSFKREAIKYFWVSSYFFYNDKIKRSDNLFPSIKIFK